MRDPVILADGHTYERRDIEKWLKTHSTSPVTRLPLEQTEVFPNHALRNSIEEYFRQVFSAHRRAIRRSMHAPTEGSAATRSGGLSSNTALLRTIDALMQCSLLMHEDLSTEQVLKEIMQEAKAMVGAEVASVFLVSADGRSLYSTVNSTGAEIRIPFGSGIAGHVASTGEAVVIRDAYSDPRFDRTVDRNTGFRTRSILCVPLKLKKGVIGVVNLINKTGEGLLAKELQMGASSSEGPLSTRRGVADGFSLDDLQFLQVFASQAATTVASGMLLEAAQPPPPVGTPRNRLACLGLRCFRAGDKPQGSENSGRPASAVGLACAPEKQPGEHKPVPGVEDAAKACPEPCEEILFEALGGWFLDDFALARSSKGRPLSTFGRCIMRRSGLVAHFGFDGKKVGRFFEEIERGQDDANPYHNSMHVSSVLHKMHTLLERTDLARRVAATLTSEGEAECAAEPLVKLACILAAAVHDYQHRGLSNDFLVRTLDDWALRYNDRQVSENHHLAAAFAVLQRKEFNFLESLPAQDFRRLRGLMISMVLGTDLAEHGSIMTAFSAAASASQAEGGGVDGDALAEGFVPRTEREAVLLLQVALKSCDLGHLTLPWEAHLSWVALLEQELFAQGDREKALGLAVSRMADREKPGVSDTQLGFFAGIVLPLFGALGSALPGAQPMLAAAQENHRRWQEAQGTSRVKEELRDALHRARHL